MALDPPSGQLALPYAPFGEPFLLRHFCGGNTLAALPRLAARIALTLAVANQH